eukprot:3296110-Rhodomonas_salina.1
MASNSALDSSSVCNSWADIQPADSASVCGDEAPPSLVEEHVAFLRKEGLGNDDALAVCSALGATCVEDFKLVDTTMAEAAASAAGLKPIAAKRLHLALEKAQGKAVSAAMPTPPVALVETSKKNAVEESTEVVNTFPREAVVICVDRSGSMGTQFDEMKAWGDNSQKTVERRSRMDAVKQVFYAFRDRTDSLGAKSMHQLGLMQFDDNLEVLLQLTNELNQFESIIDDMKHRGRTAIYSSIIEAASMLTPVFKKTPQTDLRVLVLTDGKNNAGASPQDALKAVASIRAVVDAIIVGDTPDANLLKIVSATGGECYQIHTLSDGFELMESESVVSLRARRGDTDKPMELKPPPTDEEIAKLFSSAQAVEIKSSNYGAAANIADVVKAKKVESLGSLLKKPTTASGNAHAVRRIMKELSEMAKGESGTGCHLFPDTDNMHLMRALIEGPAGTPFEGGTFVLNVTVSHEYPFKPPHVKFETPIFHCNVTEGGAICLDVLNNGWNPALTIPKVLEA